MTLNLMCICAHLEKSGLELLKSALQIVSLISVICMSLYSLHSLYFVMVYC